MAGKGWEVARSKPARLSSLDRSKELAPWKRARNLTWCSVYWIPVSGFPVPGAQRRWLLTFLERISAFLKTTFELRSEIFLQYKVLYPNLVNLFVDKAIEFRPIPGICRRPGAAMPKPITEDDIAELIKGKKFEFNDWVADYTYWFVNKLAARQRELFFGHGGMVNMFLKPDKKTEPPIVPFSPAMRSAFPIFQKFDIDAQVAQTFALADEFQDKSKKLFGNGLENDPQFRGLRFILPLLNAQNFFNEVPGEREKWFQLFDVYINESPADNGILLASAKDLDEPIIDLVRQMREENLEYPLR